MVIRHNLAAFRPCGLLVFLCLALSGEMAFANPWPRDRGQSFLAVASFDGAPSIWVDHGLGNGRTVALSAFLGRTGDRRIGLRFIYSNDLTPYWPRHGFFALAEWRKSHAGHGALTGLGMTVGADLTQPWPGWTSLELQAGLLHGAQAASGRIEWKAQGTLGLRPNDWLVVMTQLQGEWTRAQGNLHFAPSVLWAVTDQISLEFGLRRQIRGGRAQQIKLGSWLDF